MRNYRIAAVALAVGLAAGWASAEDAQSVLSDIHKDNQMEIRLGKLAQEKGQSADVRSLGERIAKDHEDADKQVQEVAQKQGIMLEPSNKMMQEIHDLSVDSLAKKSGADFDKEFAKKMVKDHQKTIASLEKAQQKLAGSPTGDLISKLLPTLHDHLDKAQKLNYQS